MKQMGIVMLGILFLLSGHVKAFSDPVGFGIDETTKEYGDYTKAIRVKIGNIMSKNLDVAEEGTVSLDFVISSDGKLVQVNVNYQKTKASTKMINTALMSVKQAAPFDPFPQPLAQKGQLPFNINLGLKLAPPAAPKA